MNYALHDWVKAELGRGQELADALGINKAVVSRWVNGVYNLGPEKLVQVARHTGIPLNKLAPDLYPPDLVSMKRKTKRRRSNGYRGAASA